MSVLRTIESKIEGLFEGVFGRAFRTHVQPVELARKLAKEMDEHRSVSVSRVYVPNEYTIYLSSADRQQFVSYEGSLVGELQEYLTEHARREAYALLTPPRVLFATDDDLAVGEFGIATRVAQPEEEVPSLPAPPRADAGPERLDRRPPSPRPAPLRAPVAAPPSSRTVRDDDLPAAGAGARGARGRAGPRAGARDRDADARRPRPPGHSRSVVIGRSRECDMRVVGRQRLAAARRDRPGGRDVLSSSTSARPTAPS